MTRKEIFDEVYLNSKEHDDVGMPRKIGKHTYVCVGWTHLKRDAEERAEEYRDAGYLARVIYESKKVPGQKHFTQLPWGIWAYREGKA
jgi:hypothetical protein